MRFKKYIAEYTTLIHTNRLDELTSVAGGDIATYEVPLMKSKTKRKFKTSVKPEDRSFKNLPRYSNKKAKVRFQDWLGIVGEGGGVRGGIPRPNYHGKSTNGKHYGWSHRAVYGFEAGQTIKEGDIAIDTKRTPP